jgi:hypothetical protein
MPLYSGIWTLSQVHQAVKNQTWTGIAPPSVEYLVVAGGAGGNNGGGGAGGLLAGFSGVTSGTLMWVTVGAGGAGGVANINPGVSTSGGNSVLVAASSGATTGNIVANGGGKGATTNPGSLYLEVQVVEAVLVLLMILVRLVLLAKETLEVAV